MAARLSWQGNLRFSLVTCLAELYPATSETVPNRSEEYRRRADEVRAKADRSMDDGARKMLLETAETWDRMAAYEDKHSPPRPKSN
jgi:non-homologous end joining protein Ku